MSVRKCVKKFLGCLFLGLIGINGITEAGQIPTNMVPLHTYSVRKIQCYNQPSYSTKQGWIDPGDYVIVTQIRSDGWAYGSYPVKNKRIPKWFRADELINNKAYTNQDRYSPKNNTNVYRNSSYSSILGSFGNNESITVVSDSGNSRQVIYKLSNGSGYKMGWVPYWDCWTSEQAGKTNRQPVNNIVNPIVKPISRVATIPNGWYEIKSANILEKGLDVANSGNQPGSNIILYSLAQTSNQKFYLENKGKGWFTLRAGHCDLYVSAANSSGANYTNVQLLGKSNGKNQLWRLIITNDKRYYYIESALREGLSFDCSNAGSANGTNIQLWDRGNVLWNKWMFNVTKAPLVWPVGGNGGYDSKNWPKYHDTSTPHKGTDISAPKGTTIYSVTTGVIKDIKVSSTTQNPKGGFGMHMIIKSNVNGRDVLITYGHMSAFNPNLKVGDTISSGTFIGKVGNTGNTRGKSGGYHLHYQVDDANTKQNLNPHNYLPKR